jgi:NADH:ubiquinone oxidoreductase subunit 3 (subunit A)
MIEHIFLIIIVVVICVLVDGVLLLLVHTLPKYNRTEIKMMRWEAGNPPMKYPKYTLHMQYFGYMFLFMAAEPIVVILFLFSAYPGLNFSILLLLTLVLFLPAIYIGYKIAYEMGESKS